MAPRSYSDVPNMVTRLFLQEAGIQYDRMRGYQPFSKVSEVEAHFGGCAYCGTPKGPFVEEHVIPRNRDAVGLHAWGNVVPACVPCNKEKGQKPWRSVMATVVPDPAVRAQRVAAIEGFQATYRYSPNTEPLAEVVRALYKLADTQTRALMVFALAAADPILAGLSSPGVP